MAPIDDAVAEVELLQPGEHFLYRAVARKFNISNSTLTRRHRGRQKPQHAQEASRQKLNPQQEEELVQYINNLTKRALPPTRAMIQNFASHIALEPYNVQPEHMYNIDKKGFMIGILGGSKRVFSRQLWEEKRVTATLQDGS
ncbi:hypothetical protein CC86DRAFT_471018 [Ophiobolus disseminans]|uniref:HTH CENPB-type domain-containing protein n=1 Tax=Ophiobolus disseminans TaxID=1469910 RepID=A0A6A6ZII4_9PLEO|nr:hypothetical protein CC86DRAFT_471018 [Ophiobolus disseminans]